MLETRHNQTQTASFAHRPLSEGVRIAEYEIDGVLGQGGFGITYRAIDRHLDRQVAIKEFFPVELACRDRKGAVVCAIASDEATFASRLDAFLAEARTLARFDHPNIVRVLSVFQAHGTAYIVMEYERGQSLSQLYEAGGIDEQALRAIALLLADGLQDLHRADFIHRDIKPENIYVRDDGSPILLDFGAARRAVGLSPSSMTCMVSPGYTPFEQFAEARDGYPQGAWTDIYALSATLYHGVCGHKPANANARAAALFGDKPDPLRPASEQATAGYSVSFLRAIDAGLAFNPSDRPQSLSEWCRLLRGAAPQTTQRCAREPQHQRRSTSRARRVNIRSWLQHGRPAVTSRHATRRNTRRIALFASLVGFALTSLAALDRADVALRATPSASSIVSLAPTASVQLEVVTTQPVSAPPQSSALRVVEEQPRRDNSASLPSTSSPVPVREHSADNSEAKALEETDLEATDLEAAVAEDRNLSPAKTKDGLTSASIQDSGARTTQTPDRPIQAEQPIVETARALSNPRRVVQDLLTRAEADLAAYRLTSPPGDNALQRFDKILVLEPGNTAALAGRGRIVARYLELVDSQRRQQRFDKARLYLAKAASLQPDSPKIAQARQRVARAEVLERAKDIPRTAQLAASSVQPTAAHTHERPGAAQGSTRAVVTRVQRPPKLAPMAAPVGCPLSRS